MFRIKKIDSHLTEKIIKVPYRIQDTIPIYRISKDGIFELEKKKGIHQFDKAYLFEDINFSTQDDETKKETLKKYKTLLNGMHVSYKIIIANHYAKSDRLRNSILRKATSDKYKKLANTYNNLTNERLLVGRDGLTQSRLFVITCEAEDFDSARTYFSTIEFNIQALFNNIGSGLIPLTATDRLFSLHSFYRMGDEDSFDFDWDEYFKLKRDWRDDIINTSLVERKEHLEFEGEACACALFARRYAAELQDDFLKTILNLPFPLIYTMDIEPIRDEYARKMLMDKYMANERSINKEQEHKNERGDFSTSVSYDKRAQQEDTERLLDGMRAFNERLFKVGMTMLVRAENKDELDSRVDKIKKAAENLSMEFSPHSYRQLDAMNTTLPIGARFVENSRHIPTDSLSIFVPFNVQEVSQPGGLCYGYNSVSKNLIIANRKSYDNANGMVFGDSGSGKSLQTKFEQGQVLAFTNDDVIVIDPMSEYKDIAEEWGGRFINLSQSEENVSYINPLHVPKYVPDRTRFIAEKAEFAFAICEQALKPTPIDALYIGLVDQVIRDIYNDYFDTYDKTPIRKRKRISSPTLKDLREKLGSLSGESIEAKILYDKLNIFTDGTLNIFSHAQEETSDNRFTVYGFSELGKMMRTMAMLVMIESITAKIKYNQASGVATWVYIDEIHELWGDEYSLRAVEKLWREVRKRGGICTGMSQNILDSFKNSSTQTIVSNSEYMMLLSQGSMDVEYLFKILDLSQEELKHVKEAGKGTGLVKFGNRMVPFNNTIPKENELYKLFNTDFHEQRTTTIF